MNSETMKHEIRQRMESSSWDAMITSSVFSRRAAFRKNVARISGIGISTAAALTIVFSSIFYSNNGDTINYSSMISAQIEKVFDGGYSESFAEKKTLESETSILVFSDDTSGIIEDALIARAQ